ncbi:MAG: hypothetical protein U9P10_09825, partial [Thermodesulfobacteriota bacterium]|nr:hypothetical protein [Thermodesulfobacteriota bacterium]
CQERERRRTFCPARLKIGNLRPMVLKLFDFFNAWQGKKSDLLWFSMFLTGNRWELLIGCFL